MDNIRIDWQSTRNNDSGNLMGQVGFAFVKSDNSIIFYEAIRDGLGGDIQTHAVSIGESGAIGTANLLLNQGTDDLSLIRSGNKYYSYVNDILDDTYGSSTLPVHISLVVGTYGTYPLLKQNLSYVRVRKYAPQDPTVQIGDERVTAINQNYEGLGTAVLYNNKAYVLGDFFKGIYNGDLNRFAAKTVQVSTSNTLFPVIDSGSLDYTYKLISTYNPGEFDTNFEISEFPNSAKLGIRPIDVNSNLKIYVNGSLVYDSTPSGVEYVDILNKLFLGTNYIQVKSDGSAKFDLSLIRK